jgi:hypothetical protein
MSSHSRRRLPSDIVQKRKECIRVVSNVEMGMVHRDIWIKNLTLHKIIINTYII